MRVFVSTTSEILKDVRENRKTEGDIAEILRVVNTCQALKVDQVIPVGQVHCGMKTSGITFLLPNP